MTERTKYVFGLKGGTGKLPSGDDNSISDNLVAWNKFKIMLGRHVDAGIVTGKQIGRAHV